MTNLKMKIGIHKKARKGIEQPNDKPVNSNILGKFRTDDMA